MAKATIFVLLLVIAGGCASSGAPLVYRHPTTGHTVDCNEAAKTTTVLGPLPSIALNIGTLGLWSIVERSEEHDRKANCEWLVRQSGYVCIVGCTQ